MATYTSKNKLTGVGALPRVQIVNPPIMILSHNVASGTIEPGDLVEPAGSGHTKAEFTVGGQVKKVAGTVASGAALAGSKFYSVAMRPVDVVNPDVQSFGPVDIVNQAVENGDFVRQVFDGVLSTTVVTPDAGGYTSGDLLAWDGAGTRPADLTGTGAWKAAGTDQPLAQVVAAREINSTTNEWLLDIRLMA